MKTIREPWYPMILVVMTAFLPNTAFTRENYVTPVIPIPAQKAEPNCEAYGTQADGFTGTQRCLDMSRDKYFDKFAVRACNDIAHSIVDIVYYVEDQGTYGRYREVEVPHETKNSMRRIAKKPYLNDFDKDMIERAFTCLQVTSGKYYGKHLVEICKEEGTANGVDQELSCLSRNGSRVNPQPDPNCDPSVVTNKLLEVNRKLQGARVTINSDEAEKDLVHATTLIANLVAQAGEKSCLDDSSKVALLYSLNDTRKAQKFAREGAELQLEEAATTLESVINSGNQAN